MCFDCFCDDEVLGEYTQCLLVQGNKSQVSFIPTQFAHEDESIILKLDNPRECWVVKKVYKTISQQTAQMNYTNQKRFEKY